MRDSEMAVAPLLLASHLRWGADVLAGDGGRLLEWVFAAGAVVLLGAIISSWLASYRTPKAEVVGSSRWFRLPGWAQVVGGLAVVVLLARLGYLLWIPLPVVAPEGVLAKLLRAVGLVTFLVGTGLVLWARWALGAMYGVSTSSAVQLREHHRLVQHGPYAYVRHPLYVGVWLTLLGTVLAYRTWAALAFLVILLSLHLRARREEAALAAAFGEAWRVYAARVPMYAPCWRREKLET